MIDNMNAMTVPEPPIARASSRVSNSITDLDVAIESLAKSIGPCLCPDYPVSEDPNDSMKMEEGSDLAKYLNDSADRIQHLVSVLRRLDERVEL